MDNNCSLALQEVCDMRPWFGFLTLALLTGLLGCGSPHKKTNSQEKAALYYQYGSRQLVQKDYTSALENLLQANQLHPDNPDIINNLALAYYYKGRYPTAKKLLQKVLKHSPQHSDTLNNLGTLAMKEGNLDQAQECFERVSKHLLFKKQFITYHNLSKIAARRGQIALSRKYNEQSLQEFDRYCPALFHHGLLFYRQRQWVQANESFKRASQGTCYDYIGNHWYQAKSLRQLNQLGEAEQILEKIKVNFPRSPYLKKITTELKEIRKIKNSTRYQERRNTLNVPSF